MIKNYALMLEFLQEMVEVTLYVTVGGIIGASLLMLYVVIKERYDGTRARRNSPTSHRDSGKIATR